MAFPIHSARSSQINDALNKDRDYIPMNLAQKVNYSINRVFTQHSGKIALTSLALLAIGGALVGLALSRQLNGTLPPNFKMPMLIAGAGVAGIGLTAFSGVNYRWRHIPKYLIGIPILSLFGRDKCLSPEIQAKTKSVGNERCSWADLYTINKTFYTVDFKETKDVHHQGFIEGYMFAEQIQEMITDVLRPMVGTAAMLTGDWSGKRLEAGLQRVKIPEQYQPYISGVFLGMQRWAEETGRELMIEEKEIELAHKFTDIYKAVGVNMFSRMFMGALGCSTIVTKNADGNVVAARTLDWPSYGKNPGMILKIYKTANGTTVESLGLPGVRSVLNATNSHGLGVIINECGNVSKGEIPYGMAACEIIESSKNVQEAAEKIRSMNNRLASSHHLTVFDRKDAINFQIYAGNEPRIERDLKDYGALVITNHAEDRDGNFIEGTLAEPSSHARKDAIRKILIETNDKGDKEVILGCITDPTVNVMDTIAAAVYDTSKNSAQYASDTYFAAQHLQDIV